MEVARSSRADGQWCAALHLVPGAPQPKLVIPVSPRPPLRRMDVSGALRWRDKLMMRVRARAAGISVPPFVSFHNAGEVTAFLARVPGPWLLKPRTLAGSLGIRKYATAEDVHRTFEVHGQARVDFVLEQFIPGDLYHVDGIVDRGTIHFVQSHRYGRPLLELAHGGGVFTSTTIDRAGSRARELSELHARVVGALGMVRGVTHAEFLQALDGSLVFVEIAARVGGAHLSDLIEQTSGVNLWREWARLIALDDGEAYVPPPVKILHGGLALCLARQATPDLTSYSDSEIAMRIRKKHHAGLVVTTDDPARAELLVAGYARRFTEEFLAVLPAAESGVGNEGPRIRGMLCSG